MRKRKVLDILSDLGDFCTHQREKIFYTLEYNENASEDDKLIALGAYKTYLDIEENILRKIDRIRWNADY